MQKTKSSAHTAASTIRPITISSNFKFDKVEKLNQIVKNITQTKVQTVNTELSATITNPSEQKTMVSEKVLETLKNRIKTNYDQLYSNYPDNKQKILKQIQTVETHIAGENQMNNKHQEVIKEKAKYDKLKAKIEQMQRKLKKLNDLKTQLQHQSGINSISIEQAEEYQQKLGEYEQKKEQIEHTNLVLEQMLKQRKGVQLHLKERYNRLTTQLNKKKQKIQKLSLQNLRKKKLLMKIVEQIEKQEQFEIPVKLAEQLSSKMQQYENQHSYNQILQHEAVLEEQRFQNIKAETMRKREEQRQARLKKEAEQKSKLDQMHNLYMIGNLEQQKLKKLCAVQSISDVVNSNLNMDKQSLEVINNSIEEQIQGLNEENRNIQSQIEDIIAGKQNEENSQETLQELNMKYEQQQRKKKLLQLEFEKKSKVSNEWLTLMHLLSNNKVTKEAQIQFIKDMMNTQKKTSSQGSRMRGSSNITEQLESSSIK